MTTYYNRTLTELSGGAKDFDFCDKQGRIVGYRWRIYQAVFTPKEGLGGYVLPDGMPLEHLAIEASPTRNGKRYGAWTGYLHCVTQAEACKLIARRSTAAYKRDSKKFGR